MFAYKKIFEQAWQITKTHKFLWIFGLFLSLIDIAGFIAGRLNDNKTKIQSNAYLAMGVIIGFIIVILLSYRVKTSIVIAVKAITDKQQTSAGKAFRTARFFYWRVFGAALLIGFGLLILIGLLYAPVSHLNAQGQIVTARSLGVIGAIILLPVAITMVLINVLAPLYIVIYDQRINEAIDKSYRLITQSWQPLLFVEIITLFLQLATLFLGTFVLKLISGMPIISGILAAAIYIIFDSFVVVFSQTVWVILFLDLIKPQKLEEVPPVVVPEIVG